MLHDGETDPRAPFLARAAGVHAIEALEDAGQVIGADTGAGVADSHDSVMSYALREDTDATAGWRVPQRVVEQVGEDLTQRLGIAVHGPRVGFELDVPAGRTLGKRTPGFAGGGVDRDPARLRLPSAGLDARQVQQIIDQALHPAGIVDDRPR